MARPAVQSATVKVHNAAELTAACCDRVNGPLFVHVLVRPGNTQVSNIPHPRRRSETSSLGLSEPFN